MHASLKRPRLGARIAQGIVSGALLLGAACTPAPAAAPAPTTAPPTAAPAGAKPTAAAPAPSAPTGAAAAAPATTAPAAAPAATAPAAAAAPTVAAAPASNPANWPTKPQDIALYQGADRQAMLEAGARKEGKVTWYGSSNIEDLRGLSEAFMKKYPFLTVDYINVSGANMVARVIQEYQANQVKADIVSVSALAQIADAGALMKFYTPSADAGLPKQFFSPDGNRAALRVQHYVFAYNTSLVPPERVPTKYEDILDPYWKDKIITEGPFAPTLGLGIVQAFGQEKGLAWLKSFAQVSTAQAGSSANLDAVISGTRPATFAALAYLVDQQAEEKRAPVKTVFFDPTVLYQIWAGPTTNAPHPNATMLLLDYLISKEGQQYWADSSGNYSPRTDVVYKQPYLQNLQKKAAAVKSHVLDDGTFTKELAPVQKTMRQYWGLE